MKTYNDNNSKFEIVNNTKLDNNIYDERNNNQKDFEIPSKYKCSRCKKDLRNNAKPENKCICSTTHPISASKSGKAINKTNIEYDGHTI